MCACNNANSFIDTSLAIFLHHFLQLRGCQRTSFTSRCLLMNSDYFFYSLVLKRLYEAPRYTFVN